MEVVVDEASIGQLSHELTREVMVLQAEEIAPRPAEEPMVPTESTMSKEEVHVTEQPELNEQLKRSEVNYRATGRGADYPGAI